MAHHHPLGPGFANFLVPRPTRPRLPPSVFERRRRGIIWSLTATNPPPRIPPGKTRSLARLKSGPRLTPGENLII